MGLYCDNHLSYGLFAHGSCPEFSWKMNDFLKFLYDSQFHVIPISIQRFTTIKKVQNSMIYSKKTFWGYL